MNEMNPLTAAEMLHDQVRAGQLDVIEAAVQLAKAFGYTVDEAMSLVILGHATRQVFYAHKLLDSLIFLAADIHESGDKITGCLALEYIRLHPAVAHIEEMTP